MSLCLPKRVSRARAAALVSSALAAASIFTPYETFGVVRRNDVPDSSYVALGNDTKYAAVGAVRDSTQQSGSGILISPKWVLTAGHLAIPSQFYGLPAFFNVGGTTAANGTNYSVTQFITPFTGDLSAGNDVALLQLSTPVTGITPASRYMFSTEQNMTGTSVGFGDSGTGTTGDQFGTQGTKRAFQNTIDGLGSAFGYSGNTMVSDFDDPPTGGSYTNDGYNSFGSSTALSLEGIVAGGDSGGGVFVDLPNGRQYVAGVHSFVTAFNPPFGDGVSANSSYSDAYGSTRVYTVNQWIDDNITNNWKTAANGTFGTAANWSVGTFTSGTPGAGDLAGFNVAGSYTVTFGAGATNHQLLVRQGDVTLDLNSVTYNQTSTMYEGGVVVGKYTGATASLTLMHGTMNTTGDVIIGQTAGSGGTIKLNNNIVWNVGGNLYVGGDFNGSGGVGTLNVATSTSALNVTGTLDVPGTGTVLFNHGSLNAATINLHGGKFIVTSGGDKVVRTQNLIISGSSTIDLTDNDLLIDYTGGTVDTQVKTWLTNNTIFTSSAIATHRTLAAVDNNILHLSTFDGVGIDFSTELVKYTFFGDADLNGQVDVDDLYRLATHWLTSTTNWVDGDFNHDGIVNGADLGLLGVNWQAGVGAPLAPALSEALASFGLPEPILPSSVPEPASLTALAAFGLLGMRRRSRT